MTDRGWGRDPGLFDHGWDPGCRGWGGRLTGVGSGAPALSLEDHDLGRCAVRVHHDQQRQAARGVAPAGTGSHPCCLSLIVWVKVAEMRFPQMVRLAILLTVTSPHRAAAGPAWPSFRGPNASGIATGSVTVASWDVASGRNIRWKATVPGLGHSSPVIADGQVFVTTAVSESGKAPLQVGLYGDPGSADDTGVQKWQLLSLDAATGGLRWERTVRRGVPRQKRHTKATHANCSPATDGRRVVAFFGSEGLHCYTVEGDEVWHRDFGVLRTSPTVFNDALSPAGLDLEWGFASSPVIHGGRVYVQCDLFTNGFLAALDLRDGKEVWRTPRKDTPTWSTPNILASGPRPQLVVNGWSHMGGYDLGTGSPLWQMSGGGDCPVPTPVIGRDLIYLTSAHGPRRPIYAVRPDAEGDISLHAGETTNRFVAWSLLRSAGAYMQTPILVSNLLYSCHDDGILSCFDAASGRLVYKERLGSGGEGFTASPVASDGKIYFTSEQGNVFVVPPGPAFAVQATNRLDEICMATPAIADRCLYFRTRSSVIAIGEAR